MNRSHRNNEEQKKPDTKGYMLTDLKYTKLRTGKSSL